MFLVGLPTKSFTLNTVPKGRGLSSLPTSSMNTAPQRTQSKMEEEIWKDIDGYDGYYQISNKGRLRGLQRMVKNPIHGQMVLKENVFSQKPNKRGYVKYRIHYNNQRKSYAAHRLVAHYFIGYSDKMIDHINGVKNDNRVENLEYVDNRENCARGHEMRLNKPVGITAVTSQYNGKIRWVAKISLNKKHHFLGSFKTSEEASKCYQSTLAEIKAYGEIRTWYKKHRKQKSK